MAGPLMLPRTAADWLRCAQEIFHEFAAALARHGVAPDAELRFIPGELPNPYYEAASRTIGIGMPDPAKIQGRLYWLFAARILGVEGVDAAIEAMADQLPLLVAHEVTHHLRHHYDAPTDNDFVEEQVANMVALAFVGEHPVYQQAIPRLRALTERGRAKLDQLSPETSTYLPGYRPELSDVLMAQGFFDQERLDNLRGLAEELGVPLDTLLVEAEVVSPADLEEAQRRRQDAELYFNRRYAGSHFEYAAFFNEWLHNYLARAELPGLGESLESYILTSDWERGRQQETHLLLGAMLRHPSDELATAAVEALAAELGAEAVTMLLDALEQRRPTLQAALLRALGRLAPQQPQAIEQAEFLLRAPQPPVRAAAAFLLVRSGGYRALEGLAALRNLLIADDASCEAALMVVAEIRNYTFFLILAACLDSPNARIRALALESLARMSRRAVTSRLAAGALDDPEDHVRRAAVRCLRSQGGAATLPLVARALNDPAAPVRAEAVEALRSHGAGALPALTGVKEGWRARSEAALLRLELGDPDGADHVRGLIGELIATAQYLTAQRAALGSSDIYRHLLWQVLGQERAKLGRMALRLGGALENPTAMELALRGLGSDRPALRAAAREMAAKALPADLVAILALFLLEDQDPFFLSAAAEPPARVADLQSYSEPFVREIVALVLAAGQQPSTAEGRPMLTTIEKLMFLRAVPAFQRIPLEDLRPLTDYVVVESYAAGESIFELEQEGDTMYIISIGRVSIRHYGPDGDEVEVAALGPGQYFGEMSLFDGKPRSASAVAAEETTVLSLAREPFLRLGARQPSMLVEVIRVLSGRLRNLIGDLDELAHRQREA